MWWLKGLGNVILSKVFQILVKLLFCCFCFVFSQKYSKIAQRAFGDWGFGHQTLSVKSIIAKQISFKSKILVMRLSSSVCADDKSFKHFVEICLVCLLHCVETGLPQLRAPWHSIAYTRLCFCYLTHCNIFTIADCFVNAFLFTITNTITHWGPH